MVRRLGVLSWISFFSVAIAGPNSILELQGPVVQKITASGVSVDIFRDATLRIGGNTFALHLTGAGVRRKKLGFINVDVYVAASYIDLPTGIDPIDPMASVRASNARAMQLVLARDLTAGQIRSGFEDALRANGADLDEPNLKAILEKLTFDMPKAAVVTIASYRESLAKEELFIEMPKDSLTGSSPDIGTIFWQNWFGIPADSGLKALKTNLVGVVP